MRNRTALMVAVAVWACCPCPAADTTPAPAVPAAPAGVKVQFTMRICEGSDKLKFWFNDEARKRWNSCAAPVPDIPVYIVSVSGKRGEGKTGKDGIAELSPITVAHQEKFRLAMACTTHHCFSIHGLYVGDTVINPGANVLYAETVAKTLTEPK